MKRVQIVGLVRRVALTLDHEIDCGECAYLVPQYVDALLSGHDGVEPWVLIRQHFEQCISCSEEFVHLHDCARMEKEETWPTVAQLLEILLRRQLNG